MNDKSLIACENLETYGPGSCALQPGGEAHAEVNAGSDDLVALVYFEGRSISTWIADA